MFFNPSFPIRPIQDYSEMGGLYHRIYRDLGRRNKYNCVFSGFYCKKTLPETLPEKSVHDLIQSRMLVSIPPRQK